MTAGHPSVAPPLLALLAALSAIPGAAAPPPPELLACHDTAVGGEALRAAERIQYRLEIVEPEFTVEGVYRADRSGHARIDIHTDGTRVFSEGWDGERAWQLGRDAAEPTFVEGEPAAALRHGVERPGHLWTLADMTAQGHRLARIDHEGS